MAQLQVPFPILLNNIGGTKSLDVPNLAKGAGIYPLYKIFTSGAVTLGADWTIAPTGTPLNDMVFTFVYVADINLNGHKLVIFGRQLLPNEAASTCLITARYHTTGTPGWLVDVCMSNNAVNEGKVFADATDPGADYLDGKVAKSIVENPATKKIELSGDVLAPGNNYYYGTNSAGTKGMFPMPLDNLYHLSLEITDASILTLNSVLLVLVPNPGAGFAIQIISVALQTKVWTVPYATNTKLQVITDTAGIAQIEDTAVLLKSVNGIYQTTPIISAVATDTQIIANKAVNGIYQTTPIISAVATDTQIIANKAVNVMIATGDPTAGDPAQSLKLFVAYKILSV